MAITILPARQQPTTWKHELAASLGTGLGQGLTNLINSASVSGNKRKFSELLQKNNYSPEQAELLTELYYRNPEGFPNILSMINPAATSQGMMQNKPVDAMQQQQQPLFTSKRSADQDIKKQQYLDKISDGLKLEDQTLGIIDQMLEDIKSGKVYSGPLIEKVAKHAPSFMNEQTERFDKNASEYINLMTQNMKGVPSRLRIQLQQQAKPGLRHSLKVNQDILERKKAEILKSRESVLKKHPELSEFFGIENQQQNPNRQMMQPKMQQEKPNIRQLPDGSIMAFDPKTGQWRKARIKG